MDFILKLFALIILSSLVQSRGTMQVQKSIELNDKMIYDCIDIYKQPSLSHPLLRNHKIQMKPSFSIPKFKNQVESIRYDQIIDCPNGTVPILRSRKEYVASDQNFTENRFNPLTVESHGTHLAGLRLQSHYYGGSAYISIHDLNITDDQISYAHLYVGSRVNNKDNFIQVGWMVNHKLFGDGRTWSYGFWKGANGACYNTECRGFVQVSKHDLLSTPLPRLPQSRYLAIMIHQGFLFLGGGMRTFSTNNGSLAMLLITLYPRLPSGPNDNRCHLQAFRHLYVLATEARWLQTIDVDSGLPVYAPLEITVKETKLYSETRFCKVTPCILPERAILKRNCVCGPLYWPQQVELVPEEKSWWSYGDKSDPFNSGVIYVKRKVGACSYVDDPVGCQSLLSRAMHKVFGLRTLGESNMLASSHRELDSDSVDHLVSTFSSDPSLIAFAQLCCDKSWNNKSDSDFKEFCLQVLFDCISKDRPALLQVYLSLYTTIGSMADLLVKSDSNVCDSLCISSLKVAVAYNEAVSSGRLASSGGFVQSIFLASLRKRCEEILNCSTELKMNLRNYLTSEAWPDDYNSKDIIILSWYLKWFSVPSPSIIKAAVEKIKSKSKISTSAIPLLRLLLPSTHIIAISEIDRVFFSSNETTGL